MKYLNNDSVLIQKNSLRNLILALLLTFLLLLQSAQANDTNVHGVLWLSKTISVSCESFPGLAHAFTQDKARSLSKDPSVKVIVVHGDAPSLDGFTQKERHVELMPVFISTAQTNTHDITRNELKEILGQEKEGRIRSEKEKEKLQVYLHKGNLQKQKFESILRTEGMAVRELQNVKPKYESTYLDLAASGGKDCNALVIGLRGLTNANLKVISIEGIDVRGPEAYSKYPIRQTVSAFLKTSDPAADAVYQEWFSRVQTHLETPKQN